MVGVVLFIANDVVWIAIAYRVNLWIADIAFRITLIVCLILWIRFARVPGTYVAVRLFLVRESTRRNRKSTRRILFWIIGAVLYGVAVDQTVWPYLYYRFPESHRFVYPELNGVVRIIDLTFGAGLVALTEELVFRSLALAVCLSFRRKIILRRRLTAKSNESTMMVNHLILAGFVFAGSIIFGVAHWGVGLHAVVSTSIWGLVPMIALIHTKSLWPAVIAHYITNVVAFAGIIPESYYQLFAP